MTQEDIQCFIERALESQINRIEVLLKSDLESLFKREVNLTLSSYLDALPELLVDKLNKGLSGRWGTGMTPVFSQTGLPPIHRGDTANVLDLDITQDCIVSQTQILTTMPESHEIASGKQDSPEDGLMKTSALPSQLPPTSYSCVSTFNAMRDVKENVLGCPEGGVSEYLESMRKDPDCFRSFVAGPIFSVISSSVILANTIYIGWETNTNMRNEIKRLNNQTGSSINNAGEYFFTIFFMVELALRIVAQKRNFIYGKDNNWNLFDSILILLSFIQLFLGVQSINLSVFRIFRIFRLVRLLKVIRRVYLLESLNLMVHGIINCFVPLFWAVCILFIVLYAFGIFFMSGVVGYLQSEAYPPSSQTFLDQIDLKYGSMYRCMCSLFEGISGGNDWGSTAEELRDIGEGLYICFALYVVFITLGVLNIVTGFFVDGTMQANVNSREDTLKQAQDKKNTMVDLIAELFYKMDQDHSGTLSFEELEGSLDDEALQEYFCVLDMMPEEAKDLFRLIDTENTGEVDISEFTKGCLKVMGVPKNLDLCMSMYQTKKMMLRLDTLSDTLRKVLNQSLAFPAHSCLPNEETHILG